MEKLKKKRSLRKRSQDLQTNANKLLRTAGVEPLVNEGHNIDPNKAKELELKRTIKKVNATVKEPLIKAGIDEGVVDQLVEGDKISGQESFYRIYLTLLQDSGQEAADAYKNDMLEHLLYIKANKIQMKKALGITFKQLETWIRDFRKCTFKKINNLEWYDIFSDNQTFVERSSGQLLTTAIKLLKDPNDLQAIRTANQLFRTALLMKKHSLSVLENLGWVEHHKYVKPVEENSSENKLNIINKAIEASSDPFSDTTQYLKQIEELIPGITTNKELAKQYGYLQAFNLANGLDADFEEQEAELEYLKVSNGNSNL